MALLLNANDTVSRSYSYTIPSPNHVSEVQAVGDRTANLFDGTICIDNVILSQYGNLTPNDSYALSEYIPVEPNMSYIYHFYHNIAENRSTYSICEYDSNQNVIQPLTVQWITENRDYNISFTTQANTAYIRINWKKAPDDDLMLIKGLTPLPYEPYGYKIPVVTRGKNLFDYNAEYTDNIQTKMYTISNLDTNKYYTCSTSFEKIPGVGAASLYFAGGSSSTNGVWKNTPRTFKPDANGQIAVYVRYAALSGAPAIFNKVISGEITVMVEEGTTATPYEPYHEPITTPIYLPTPLYSGEVMRSDGTITRSDGTTKTFTAPQIPTLNGTTVIDVDTAVKPTEMYAKYKSSK